MTVPSSIRLLGVYLLVMAAMYAMGCGGGSGSSGEEVDPSQVRHRDLSSGFWVAVEGGGNVVSFDEAILQFTTVERARALYGELGVVHGAGGRNAITVDQSLSFFDGDDSILLTFTRDRGRVQRIEAVRVAGGKVGRSRLGFVGFDYGFEQPIEVPIERFVRGESLVWRRYEGVEQGQAYRWVEDCRWLSESGWESTRAVLDGPYNPWFSVGMTQSGDIVGGFHPDVTNRFQMLVWQEGACPVYASETALPMAAGAQLLSDGAEGLVGIRRTTSGLGTVHLRPEMPLVESVDEPPLTQTPVEQIRRLDDGRIVFLETDLRLDRSQSAAERWVARPGESAEPWPLPALPSFDDNLHVRLRADGRAFITWTESIRGEGRTNRLQREEADGTWRDIQLEVTTEEGVTLNLAAFDRHLAPLEMGVDGQIVVLVSAEGWVSPPHTSRRLPAGARAVVRVVDGVATMRLLPAGSGGRTFAAHLTADGTWRGFGEYGPADREGTELEVITWKPDGELEVLRPGLITRPNQRGLHGFWDFAWYLGTYIWHRRHLQVEDNGALLVSNGWSSAFVRPPDAAFKPREVTIRLELENAPEGARLESMHGPDFVCEASCEVTAPWGTVVGMRVTSPPGWVVEGSSLCPERYVDAELCTVVVLPGWTCPEDHEGEPSAPACEEQRTYRVAWQPTAVLDMTDAQLPGWWGSVVADARGDALGLLNVVAGALPDGTVVEGGDNADPIPVVTRWQGTRLQWATPLPRYGVVEFMGFMDSGDPLIVLGAPDRRTLTLPEGVGVEGDVLRSGERAVLRFAQTDGRWVEATRIALPAYFVPRAFATTALGNPLSFGRSFTPTASSQSPADAVIPLDHELLLHHLPDGSVEVLYERPETRGGGSARFAAHPDGGLLFLRLEGNLLHWHAYDADLQPLGGSTEGLDLQGHNLLDAYAVADTDGFLVGFAGASVAPDGTPVVDGSHAVVVLTLDRRGTLLRSVALPNDVSLHPGKVLGLTRLADGRLMAVVRRGTAGGIEALLLEGEPPMNVGSFSTQVTQQEGFLTAGLFARPDGTLAWVTRIWERPMVLRPFFLRGTSIVKLDPEVWTTLPQSMLSERVYIP